MAQQKTRLCVILIMVLTQACGQVQTPAVTPIPSSTSSPTAGPSHTPRPANTSAPTATTAPVHAGPFQRVVSFPKETIDHQTKVRALADGSVWIITSQSVFRWDGQELNPIKTEEGMRADVDESGRLWLLQQGTDEITAWQNGQQITYGTESGWTNTQTSSGWSPKSLEVFTAKDGIVWLSTGQDVRRFDGQRWKIYTREGMGFPSLEQEGDVFVTYQIALVGGGAQIWVGECQSAGPGPIGGAGVRWFDGATWHRGNAVGSSACISTLDLDSAGNLWISADDIIWSYEPAHQKWTSYPLPKTTIEEEGYNFAYPFDLIVDHSGDIWTYLEYCGGASCGTGYKLHHIHGGRWTQVFEKSLSDPIYQDHPLVLDKNGDGWLFSGEIVYQLQEHSLKPVAEIPILSTALSPDGKMWVVSWDALWRLEP